MFEPVGVTVDAIAGDARFVADDGAARAYEPIEQRGLADVGSADDSDQRKLGHVECVELRSTGEPRAAVPTWPVSVHMSRADAASRLL